MRLGPKTAALRSERSERSVVFVRPAIYAEARILKAIAYQHQYTKHFNGPAYCNRPHFAEGGVIAAEVDNIIVGFASVRIKKRKPEIEIDIIGVAKQWRGHGVGRSIIGYLQWTTPHKFSPSIVLNVMNDNPDAIRFYRRYGFVDIGPIMDGFATRMVLTW